jgi:hypothetical protein
MFVKPKLEEQAEARQLRHTGLPYREIARRLGVSLNSAYRWTNDIELTPEQREYNLRGPRGPQNPDHIRRRMAAWSARCRAKRAAYQAEGRAAARLGDPLHLSGCMLYWAEGSKARNQAKFTNSDLEMLRVFRAFIVDCMRVDLNRIRLHLNVYTNNGLSISEIESHWLDALALPRSSLRKHSLNHMPTSSSGRAKNKLPYGVCNLTVSSTRLIQHIYGAIQEYAGFDEPAWLDGPSR